jgi:replicative DNA helicase
MSKDISQRNYISDDQFEFNIPHSLPAERAVLGAVLLENSLCEEMIAGLSAEDFFLHNNRIIFRAMVSLWNKHMPIDGIVTLPDELGEDLKRIGGITYISDLISGVPRTDSIEYAIKILKKRSRARKLIHASRIIAAAAFETPDDDELGNNAQQIIASACPDDSDISDHLMTAYTASSIYIRKAYETRARGSRITGIATGYDGFDIRTLGLQKQDIHVIAGRPSTGKTTWGTNICDNIADDEEKPTRGVIITIEMKDEQIGEKLISRRAAVDSLAMRSGHFPDDRVESALRRIKTWGDRLWLYDQANVSFSKIRTVARTLKRQGGLDYLMVDYLGLIEDPPRAFSRNDAVSKNMRDLKQLAKELNIAIILLCQLSRSPETRGTIHTRPRLTDLRESGEIEQSADVVAFLWRPPKSENTTNVYIAKQRNGPPGEFALAFHKEHNKFENLAGITDGLFEDDKDAAKWENES